MHIFILIYISIKIKINLKDDEDLKYKKQNQKVVLQSQSDYENNINPKSEIHETLIESMVLDMVSKDSNILVSKEPNSWVRFLWKW